VSTVAPLWPAPLRDRLLELRSDMLARMERRASVEPALLPVFSGIASAIEALDRAAPAAAPAAVVDCDGTGAEIRLVMYPVTGSAIAASISALAAVRLGGELLAAAGERLAADLAELRARAATVAR
jgi:hypothetical protein